MYNKSSKFMRKIEALRLSLIKYATRKQKSMRKLVKI